MTQLCNHHYRHATFHTRTNASADRHPLASERARDQAATVQPPIFRASKYKYSAPGMLAVTREGVRLWSKNIFVSSTFSQTNYKQGQIYREAIAGHFTASFSFPSPPPPPSYFRLLLLLLLFVEPAGTPPITLQPSRPFVL
jgi:hypothetical protein